MVVQVGSAGFPWLLTRGDTAALNAPSVVADINDKVGGRAFQNTIVRGKKLYLSVFVLHV